MKCVSGLLLILTLVGSGCAVQTERVVYGESGNCKAPPRPIFAQVDGSKSFDAPENIAALMMLTDQLKDYAARMESANRCWETQQIALREQAKK